MLIMVPKIQRFFVLVIFIFIPFLNPQTACAACSSPVLTPTPGLYHIGFKIGDGADAARNVYRELRERGVTIVGTGDHTVTHSIYILDPDGNELELYADIGDAWKTNPQAVLSPVQQLNLE